MAKVLHRGCAWLLMVVVAFHAWTALYLDGRGPAHFHVHAAGDAHSRDDDHSHDHDRIEKHHHPRADASVVWFDAAPESTEGQVTPGRSAIMLSVLVPAATASPLSLIRYALIATPQPLLRDLFAGRFERPPRTAPA